MFGAGFLILLHSESFKYKWLGKARALLTSSESIRSGQGSEECREIDALTFQKIWCQGGCKANLVLSCLFSNHEKAVSCLLTHMFYFDLQTKRVWLSSDAVCSTVGGPGRGWLWRRVELYASLKPTFSRGHSGLGIRNIPWWLNSWKHFSFSLSAFQHYKVCSLYLSLPC